MTQTTKREKRASPANPRVTQPVKRGVAGEPGAAGGPPEDSGRLDSLLGLFVHELRDTYNAEQQLITALPKMAELAEDQELATAVREHLEQTRGQLRRLDQIFASLNVSPKGIKCAGMAGILDEGKELIGKDLPGSVRDAALIAGGQRVEHYEMAAYGTLRAYAEQLGLHDAADLLDETLQEEGAADVRLSRLAERRINAGAMQGVA